MVSSQFVILGCGYTGRRVAQRLLARGASVLATSRDPVHLIDLAGANLFRMEILEPDTVEHVASWVEPDSTVLLSIPVIRDVGKPFDPTSQLIEALRGKPARAVYLSTTGVYGETVDVDENAPAAPVSETDRLRVQAEQRTLAADWSSLVLRPAAIYGPGRGVHESIRRGRYRLAGEGDNYVSRIHVEDLAALTEAALLSDLTGAWPVADQEPCTSAEMASYCAKLLGLPRPASVPREEVHHTRRANRRVDGSAVFRALGVPLRYSSYRDGVVAAIAESEA